MSKVLQYLDIDMNNPPNECVKYILDKTKNMKDYSVLEIGTLRWKPDYPTHHKPLFPNAGEYIMTDVTAGTDVDVVSDAHDLVSVFGENRFDVVWTSSTFEHLHSPWIAAEQILKVLKPNGWFMVQTHFQFPLHGYPFDYFRFSREALEHIFKQAKNKISCYQYPAKIVPNEKIDPWNEAAESYLNVCISGEK